MKRHKPFAIFNDHTFGIQKTQGVILAGAITHKERQARFLATYGFASDALPSEHFLTPTRLDELASELGLAWRIHTPALDWRTRLGRTIGGLRARREPARFPVIVGKRR